MCEAHLLKSLEALPPIVQSWHYQVGLVPLDVHGDLERGIAQVDTQAYYSDDIVSNEPGFYKPAGKVWESTPHDTHFHVHFDSPVRFTGVRYQKAHNIKEVEVWLWREATESYPAEFIYFDTHSPENGAAKVGFSNNIAYSSSKFWFIVRPESLTVEFMALSGIELVECGCDYTKNCCEDEGYTWKTNPDHCPCLSKLGYCCEHLGDRYPENPVCPCNPDLFCCGDETDEGNSNCCDSTQKCCEWDFYPENELCCESQFNCCDGDTW